MKIDQIQLRAYGPFTDLTLDFSAGNPGFHLIYGPNEAGKSSSLRALRAVLYKFPQSTGDDHLHEYKKLRVGARLVHSDGSSLEFVRRKAKQSIYNLADSDPIDEPLISRFLDGVDEPRFNELFGLDHAGLRAGGKAMVEGGGDLQQALVAASGLAELQKTRNLLIAEVDELFTARASTRIINKTMKEWTDAREQVTRAWLAPAEWIEENQYLEVAQRGLAEAETLLRSVKHETRRIDSLIKARPAIEQRTLVQRELAALGEFIKLDENFITRRRNASLAQVQARGDLAAAKAEVERLADELKLLGERSPYLAEAKSYQELTEARGSYRKALSQRPSLFTKIEQNRGEINHQLAAIRPDANSSKVPRLRLSIKRRDQMNRLITRRGMLISKRDDAKTDLESRIEREPQDRLTLPADQVDLLRTLAHRLRAQGDLESQLESARSNYLKLEKKAATALKTLGLWVGDLHEAGSLTLPTLETVDRFDRELTALRAEASTSEKEVADSTKLKKQAERDIKKCQAAGEIPQEADLHVARTHRDALWTRYVEKPTPKEAPSVTLAIGTADEIADRLRREADRVANLAGYQATLERAETDLQTASSRRAEATVRIEKTEKDWANAWLPAKIIPLSPTEMKAWKAKHTALLALIEPVETSRVEITRLERLIEVARHEIEATLNEPRSSTERSLVASIEYVESMIRAFESQASNRLEIASSRRRLRRVRTLIKTLDGTWTKLVGKLGLTSSATPDEARRAIQRLDQLVQFIQVVRDEQNQLVEIDRVLAVFTAEARAIGSRVGIETSEDQDPLTSLDTIGPILQTARDVEVKRESIAQQRNQAETRFESVVKKLTEADSQLESLRVEARCGSVEDLPDAERRSSEGTGLFKTLSGLDAQLTALAGSSTVEDLVVESEGSNLEELSDQLTKNQTEVERLEVRVKELFGAVVTLQGKISQMDGASGGAQAAERLAEIEAQLQHEIDRYVQLKITTRLLTDALDSFRQKNQMPLIKRASEHFKVLTLGSFSAIKDDEDEKGKTVIMGIRQRDGSAVGVGGMSDGTADALFLALRIAAIERHLAAHQPLPVIADDLLVNFDDDRATAALRVLAELSKKTQVLFFTHHARLRDLAQGVLSEPDLCLHTLPGRTVLNAELVGSGTGLDLQTKRA